MQKPYRDVCGIFRGALLVHTPSLEISAPQIPPRPSREVAVVVNRIQIPIRIPFPTASTDALETPINIERLRAHKAKWAVISGFESRFAAFTTP